MHRIMWVRSRWITEMFDHGLVTVVKIECPDKVARLNKADDWWSAFIKFGDSDTFVLATRDYFWLWPALLTDYTHGAVNKTVVAGQQQSFDRIHHGFTAVLFFVWVGIRQTNFYKTIDRL